MLKKNYFPINLVDKCIKIFLNIQILQKILEYTGPKKSYLQCYHILVCLPFVSEPAYKEALIATFKTKIIFKSSTRLANFFRFRDKIPLCLRSNIVYNFMFSRCNATYYGETCRHFKVTVGKHSGVSPLTNKRSKSKKINSR